MITLLSKIFVKNNTEINSSRIRQMNAILCSIVSIFLNVILFTGKLTVGTISGSVAITADAFNNLADAGTCLAELLGFCVAGIGAGKRHPFGHGRIEWLMGLFAAIVVLFMGLEMIKTSIAAIVSPKTINFSLSLIMVLVCGIAVKTYMYFYNTKIGKKIGSVTMKAKAFDCLGDLAATTAVLLSTLIVKFTGWQIDGWCGLIVSAFILYAGLQALNEAISPLIGKAPDKELIKRIEQIVEFYPDVIGIYDLMVHDYGFNRLVVSFRIAGSGESNVERLAGIADSISYQLHCDLDCDATIQIELLNTNEILIDNMLSQVIKAVHEVDSSIKINNFRITQKETSPNAVMDVIMPIKLMKKELEIKQVIESTVKLIDDSYSVIMKTQVYSFENKHKKFS